MTYVSRPFYFWSYLIMFGAGLVNAAVLISSGGKFDEDAIPIFFITGAIGLYALVVLLVLYYKMWSALPPSIARITPAKAVGFMFIPVFNFYWMFKAVWGWTKDFNTYREQSQFNVPAVSSAVAFTACLLGVIGGIVGWITHLAGVPIIGTLISIPGGILFLIFIFQTCTALNALPAGAIQTAHQARVGTEQATYSQGFGIASLVLGILSIIIPYLGLIAGIVAIVLAKMQRKKGPSGLATAGKILGIIGTSLWCVIIALIIIVVATH